LVLFAYINTTVHRQHAHGLAVVTDPTAIEGSRSSKTMITPAPVRCSGTRSLLQRVCPKATFLVVLNERAFSA
jgi:hypothetical protein